MRLLSCNCRPRRSRQRALTNPVNLQPSCSENLKRRSPTSPSWETTGSHYRWQRSKATRRREATRQRWAKKGSNSSKLFRKGIHNRLLASLETRSRRLAQALLRQLQETIWISLQWTSRRATIRAHLILSISCFAHLATSKYSITRIKSMKKCHKAPQPAWITQIIIQNRLINTLARSRKWGLPSLNLPPSKTQVSSLMSKQAVWLKSQITTVES